MNVYLEGKELLTLKYELGARASVRTKVLMEAVEDGWSAELEFRQADSHALEKEADGELLRVARVWGSDRDHRLDVAYEAESGLMKVRLDESGYRHKRLEYSWDAKTGTILADSNHSYTVEQNATQDSSAAIARTSRQTGKRDFWQMDWGHGLLRKQINGGPVVETIRHMGGPLRGKLSSIREVMDGHREQVYRASYDSKARIIREFRDGTTMMYRYNDRKGQVDTLSPGGKLLARAYYDASTGRALGSVHSNGKRIRYEYQADGSAVVTAEHNGVVAKVLLDPHGTISSVFPLEQETGNQQQ